MKSVLVFGNADSPNLQALAAAMAGAGQAIHIASFERWGATRSESQVTIMRGKRSRLRYLTSARHARRLVRESGPDTTLGYFATGYGTLALLSGGRPLVVAAVGSDLLQTSDRSIAGRLRNRALRSADLVLAVSEELGALCRERGAYPVLVLPHGIDRSRYLAADEPTGAVRVVATRSLTAFYRHDLIIKAFAGVADAHELTIVGDGPYRTALEELAAQLCLGAVTFLGRLPHEQLPTVLASHHVYATAAPSDGTSASLLEAMAVGLTPVVTDNAANRAWVRDGYNGLLFDSANPGAIRAQLQRALMDTDLRARCRSVNPKIIAERADIVRNTSVLLNAMENLDRHSVHRHRLLRRGRHE